MHARESSRFGRRISALRFLCFISIIAAVLVSPALSGTKYMAGSPELNAHISGTNEFSPGDDVNLQVVIENTGLNQFKIVQSTIIDPDRSLQHGQTADGDPGCGGCPTVVKADPQIVG